MLTTRVGPDARRLTNEIKKLATAALPENHITGELVESLVSYSRELRNFDLTDYLVAGRKTQALTAVKKILDDGVEPLQLLGLISYNYRRLLMVSEMMSKGVDRREVASVAKLRYNDQEAFFAAARRANPDKLASAIRHLAKTDLAVASRYAELVSDVPLRDAFPFLAHRAGLSLLLILLRHHSVLCNRTGSAKCQNESRCRECQNARVHSNLPHRNVVPPPHNSARMTLILSPGCGGI